PLPFSKELIRSAEKAWEGAGTGSPDVYLLAWTTTPWTLPSNLGLTVGPHISYLLLKTFNPYTHLPVNVVVAKPLLSKYFKPEGENTGFEDYSAATKILPWQVLREFTGRDLDGCYYEPILSFEANSLA